MKLHEYQARQLLEQAGIPTSPGQVVRRPDEAPGAFRQFAKPTAIAKVQVHMGGRGKAGGVKRIATAEEATAFVSRFIDKPFSTTQSAGESKIVRSVLFTEDRNILEEYYLGIVVDRGLARPVMLVDRKSVV